jgi:hypothetical protein
VRNELKLLHKLKIDEIPIYYGELDSESDFIEVEPPKRPKISKKEILVVSEDPWSSKAEVEKEEDSIVNTKTILTVPFA